MSETKARVGIERYAERSRAEAERLAVLQDHRAGLRPIDADLVSATLQAVELVDAAASALECAGSWSEAERARLRMVANLLLALDEGRVNDYSRWFSVVDLPFMQSTEPREIGRQVLRAVARTLEPVRAERLYQAADLLRGVPDHGVVADLLTALRAVDAHGFGEFPDGPDDPYTIEGITPESLELWRVVRAAIARAEGRATPAPQGATQEGEG